PMASAKLRPDAFQPFTIASDHNDVIAVRGKEPGQLETDPASGAGNQRRSVQAGRSGHQNHCKSPCAGTLTQHDDRVAAEDSGPPVFFRRAWNPLPAAERLGRCDHRKDQSMQTMLVRYRAKPEKIEENQRLIGEVFRELQAKSPADVRYL